MLRCSFYWFVMKIFWLDTLIKPLLIEKGVELMVNENFGEFIKAEAKHKSQYLGSRQPSHGNYKNDEEINSRTNTDDSVGADGRDVFK